MGKRLEIKSENFINFEFYSIFIASQRRILNEPKKPPVGEAFNPVAWTQIILHRNGQTFYYHYLRHQLSRFISSTLLNDCYEEFQTNNSIL